MVEKFVKGPNPFDSLELGEWHHLKLEAEGANFTLWVNDMIYLEFQDDTIGVAVGVGGCILRSQDGGETWQDISSPTSHHLYRVKSIDGDFYAVGLRGTLLKSADQGQKWESISLSPEVSLNWHYGIASNSGEIFLAGETGKVFKK